MNSDDISLCQRYAEIYKIRGFQPLPSSPTEKKPLIRYADLWDKKANNDLFTRFRTSNLQVMCGIRWSLLVIDLDGDEAKRRWDQMGQTPRTWISHSGGGGRHLWFRLPEGLTQPIGKAFLWRGEGKHNAIERLCDYSLVMAPPSIHPVTKQRYRFEDRWHSPLGMGLPADCPRWILRIRPVVLEPVAATALTPVLEAKRRVVSMESSRMDWHQVIDSVPDKIGLVRSWGIKFSVRPGQREWVECHSIDREDIHPSAAINRRSGYYVDRGSGVRMNLLGLGVKLGIFQDWREACRTLAEGRTRP